MADQSVAHIVAIVIIHILKTVQIDKHHALHIVLTRVAHLAEPQQQRTPVGQAAEPVNQGDLPRLTFAAGQLIHAEAAEQNKQQDQAGGHPGDQPHTA